MIKSLLAAYERDEFDEGLEAVLSSMREASQERYEKTASEFFAHCAVPDHRSEAKLLLHCRYTLAFLRSGHAGTMSQLGELLRAYTRLARSSAPRQELTLTLAHIMHHSQQHVSLLWSAYSASEQEALVPVLLHGFSEPSEWAARLVPILPTRKGVALLGALVASRPARLHLLGETAVVERLISILSSDDQASADALHVFVMLLPQVVIYLTPLLPRLLELIGSVLCHAKREIRVLAHRLVFPIYLLYPCSTVRHVKNSNAEVQKRFVEILTSRDGGTGLPLHASLITSSPQIETAPDRWRHIDTSELFSVYTGAYLAPRKPDSIPEDLDEVRGLLWKANQLLGAYGSESDEGISCELLYERLLRAQLLEGARSRIKADRTEGDQTYPDLRLKVKELEQQLKLANSALTAAKLRKEDATETHAALLARVAKFEQQGEQTVREDRVQPQPQSEGEDKVQELEEQLYRANIEIAALKQKVRDRKAYESELAELQREIVVWESSHTASPSENLADSLSAQLQSDMKHLEEVCASLKQQNEVCAKQILVLQKAAAANDREKTTLQASLKQAKDALAESTARYDQRLEAEGEKVQLLNELYIGLQHKFVTTTRRNSKG